MGAEYPCVFVFQCKLTEKTSKYSQAAPKTNIMFGGLPKMCYLCIGYEEMPHIMWAYCEKIG